MPRRPRAYWSDIPVHVVQRGVNRQPCFFADGDRRLYLDTLGTMCRRFDVDLHAFVLMTNHVHLLLTPSNPEGISRVMQGLGRIYVRRVNDRVERTGTLWEGRHRDSLIDCDRYLLACHRYIEMNPVRAGMVMDPGAYPWSSHRQNLSGSPAGNLVPHSIYLGLGSTAAARSAAYRSMFGIEDDDAVEAFREGLRRAYPVGGRAFLERLRDLGLRIGRAEAGRPLAACSQEPE
ncbi:MAG TPA: transposase [Pseudomonadales bacterium]|nr:transposase [Pseudomonadales bacterium]